MKLKDFIPPVFSKSREKINQMIVAHMLGQPVWTPTNFENLAKEGFESNVWVYRCVMEIAKAGSNIPIKLYRRDSNGELKEIDNHDLINLLRNPNPQMSMQEFMENVIAFSQLAGNSYFLHNGPTNKPPRELWVMKPDRMKVIPDKQDLIGGYEYWVNGQRTQLDASEISHIKLFSALDDFYGLSPIQVGAKSIDSDNFANNWNASLLQNGARPSGAMVTEGVLGDTEYKRLQKSIEEQHSGAKNAGRPMLLEGGLDWKQLSMSPKEMDFQASKSMTRLEICSAFGVPPEIIGDHEHATYSNYQEARKGFYQDTVIPVLNKVIDVMNNDLVAKFDSSNQLFLQLDRSQIDALQEDRDAVYNRAIKGVQAGILEVNEGREEMGYEAVNGGNVRYVPSNVMPEGEDAPSLDALTGQNSNNNSDSDSDNNNKMGFKSLNLQTKTEKKQYWRSFDRMRTGFYGSAGKQIAKRFEDEQKAVLKAFDEGGENAVSELLDSDTNSQQWNKSLNAIYIAVMEKFGEKVFDSLMGNDEKSLQTKDEHQDDTEPKPRFDVYHDAVQGFISKTVADKVVGIQDTTKRKIKATIRRGFEDNMSLPEIRDEIDKLYLDQIIPNRSMVIARTEVIGASNAGSRQAAKQTGLNLKKEWVATADERTRDTHEEADGQIKDMDEPFEVGGSQLMYPGDANAGGDEVIQCRCTEVYHTQ